MAKKIILTIAPNGECVIKVEGCAGPSCKDLTRALENALGATTDDKKTAEYTQTETQKGRLKA